MRLGVGGKGSSWCLVKTNKCYGGRRWDLGILLEMIGFVLRVGLFYLGMANWEWNHHK